MEDIATERVQKSHKLQPQIIGAGIGEVRDWKLSCPKRTF